jgi:hypothetical protein
LGYSLQITLADQDDKFFPCVIFLVSPLMLLFQPVSYRGVILDNLVAIVTNDLLKAVELTYPPIGGPGEYFVVTKSSHGPAQTACASFRWPPVAYVPALFGLWWLGVTGYHSIFP